MKITTICCLVLFLIMGAGIAQARNLQPPNLCDSSTPGLVETKSQYRFDPCHTGFNAYEYILSPANVGSLVQAWQYTTGGLVHSSPAVANGIVYIGSDDHNLYALNASTGALLWQRTTGNQVYSSPTVNLGIVYVLSSDGLLYAMNASNGNPVWQYWTGSVVSESSPAVSGGVVYVVCPEALCAVDARTGLTLWTAGN